MTLDEFNCLSSSQAETVLLECCHSQWWAELMVEQRPYESKQSLLNTAEEIWLKAQEKDILEAFLGHAKIGDLSKNDKEKVSELTLKEQGQVVQTTNAVLDELKQLNELYSEKFGFIYIVCATGKPAEEMLNILQGRIKNTRAQELTNGAAEQNQITKIRINNLVERVL